MAELQALQKEMGTNKDCTNTIGSSFSKTSTNLVTTLPLYTKELLSSNFLSSRPVTALDSNGSNSKIGLLNATCVLDNGSRMYLRRRQIKGITNDHNIIDCNGATTSTKMVCDLLSKPIAELVREAEVMQVNRLAKKQDKISDDEINIQRSLTSISNGTNDKVQHDFNP